MEIYTNDEDNETCRDGMVNLANLANHPAIPSWNPTTMQLLQGNCPHFSLSISIPIYTRPYLTVALHPSNHNSRHLEPSLATQCRHVDFNQQKNHQRKKCSHVDFNQQKNHQRRKCSHVY